MNLLTDLGLDFQKKPDETSVETIFVSI